MPNLLFIDFYEAYIKENNLSEKDILCILSCFYDLKVKDEVKQFTPPFLKHQMQFIYNTYEELCALELKHEVFHYKSVQYSI